MGIYVCVGGGQIDDVVPSLLVLPAGTDLHDHPMVKDGRLVLQGAHLLYGSGRGFSEVNAKVTTVSRDTLELETRENLLKMKLTKKWADKRRRVYCKRPRRK